ncbi:hypothetical protein KY358_05835 [Candidatus Woesearchaeota archaeon]|nr:hypothetical protein [Candidatus Woesearchaeota archaeon]
MMIDRKDFKKIRDTLAKYDSDREKLIKKSRDVLKLSKHLIYSLHRKNMPESEKLLKAARKEKAALDRIASANKKLFYEGSYSQAMQEYVEALSYYSFVKNKRIAKFSELKVGEEDYLMGICDLTGELARKAVTIAHKEKKEVGRIKDLIEDIFGEFIKLNLRNSELRRKSDSIKWNLKKLEEVIYDLKKK